jgi:hypothetical protein
VENARLLALLQAHGVDAGQGGDQKTAHSDRPSDGALPRHPSLCR